MTGFALSSRRKKEEGAERPFEAQDILLLHLLEYVLAKRAAVVPQVQLQERVVVRCVRHREAAADLVGEYQVYVLPGEELQPFVGRELEMQQHDVGRRTLHFHHARGHHLDLDALHRRADLAAFDHEIARRPRLAEQCHAGVFFRLGHGVFLVGAVVHGSFNQPALAGTAGAAAAAVGDDDAGAQGGFEHGFAVVDSELMSARLDRDLMGHGFDSATGQRNGAVRLKSLA